MISRQEGDSGTNEPSLLYFPPRKWTTLMVVVGGGGSYSRNFLKPFFFFKVCLVVALKMQNYSNCSLEVTFSGYEFISQKKGFFDSRDTAAVSCHLKAL